MSLSNKAILEISELSSRAERLAKGSVTERKQSDILIQRISTIKMTGLSSDEMRARYAGALGEELGGNQAEHRARFDKYLAGKINETEMRDFEAGTQSISYIPAGAGAMGGFLVPTVYDSTLRVAMAQVDQVLDEDVTDFSFSGGAWLHPEQVSGYDLSSIAGQLVGETVQQTGLVIPTVAGATLRNNLTFRATFGASLEAEQDIPAFAEKIVRAAGVALARIIASHILIGRGGAADITGIATLLTSSYTNATSGKLTLTDLSAIYFGVNRFYRQSKKAGWLVSDGGYKLIRQAVDGAGRPLVDVIDGQEVLFGKNIYLCPSLGALYSSIGLTGAILFGDLSHVVIRASRPTIQRTVEQTITDITRGECLYVARCRADATIFDPSGGNTPPIILATVN